MNLKKQLACIYTNNFFSGLRITDAVWVALLAARGFSLWEIGVAESVFHMVSLTFEVPSGMAADLLGRRKTLVAGGVCMVLSNLLMAFAPDLFFICLAMALSALANAMFSGTASALTYDSLKQCGRTDDYLRVSANCSQLSMLATAVGSLASTLERFLRFSGFYLLSAAFEGTAAAATALMTEPIVTETQARREEQTFRGLPGQLARLVRDSITALRATPLAAKLIVSAAVLCIPSYLTKMFVQQRLVELGWPTALLFVPMLLSGLASMLGVEAARRLHPKSLRWFYAVCALLCGGGCALVGAAMAVGGVGGMTLGTVVAFLSLNKGFNMPISQVSMQANSVIMALAGAERIFKMMDEPSETDEGYVTLINAKYDKDDNLVEANERTGIWAWKHPHHDGTTTYHKLEGDITFTDVDFGYVPEKTVLHDINLYGRPGQKIAFVGSTGAGKTTITNLINRFYDIQDGKIRYDGINIHKIRKADLRRSLGIVLQDTHLFTGTVMENIRYGRLTATDEECMAAAKLANADTFIKHLPDGYNTMLTGDGTNLSQGQRQLLAIARAAVADPPVMILDEATSSIDTRTELLVQRGMDALMKGRTVFVIAHRLSTVQNSDAIMVLDHGRIIERGTHDDLIAQKGTYYQLYTGAFELE